MKAAQIFDYGGQDVMKTVDTAEKPKAGPGQVLVEVHAAALNPFDWKVREGHVQAYIKLEFPAILGGDVAGVVAELGGGVSGFEVGQAVYGSAGAASGQGSLAEFTPVKADQLAPKPSSTDYAQAAALPLAATSAYQALVEHANLQAGQKILIHGGAGGIGSFAIQIAKQLGAYVATTASAEDLEFVTSLGADEAIDYQAQDFATVISGYDAVFDTVGGETNAKSYGVLKSGGVLVSMTDQPDEEKAKQAGITYVHQSSRATTERLTKVAELVDAGVLKVNVDKTFSLDQAAEAMEYLKTGHPRGKVVVEVK
ncbi:MAG TPA: NADP-dependent oxidoreductase [Candidatus Saccharimonadales bacterium]|jgi:NADPH:quinone reductase-like Zn-dependent oxidoreductase|nr:NADP-dependent oxidoreductase [Candidatus Saccharimonadales bacterium]